MWIWYITKSNTSWGANTLGTKSWYWAPNPSIGNQAFVLVPKLGSGSVKPILRLGTSFFVLVPKGGSGSVNTGNQLCAVIPTNLVLGAKSRFGTQLALIWCPNLEKWICLTNTLLGTMKMPDLVMYWPKGAVDLLGIVLTQNLSKFGCHFWHPKYWT